MNIISHYRLAKSILHYLQEEYGIRLRRHSFIFGNLKPDISGEFLWSPHTCARFDPTLKQLRSFLQRTQSEKISESSFGVKLGEFCHYLSDFFCYAHNPSFTENILGHHAYEWELGKCLKHVTMPKGTTNTAKSPMLLEQTLRSKHAEYAANVPCMENDAAYIPLICCFLVSSVALQSEKAIENEHTAEQEAGAAFEYGMEAMPL